ncbi:hypothetical protein KKH35_02730 [Patescibacteria group bacterium]|nr:hypothetical protein [Patescibacteria group bacterium]
MNKTRPFIFIFKSLFKIYPSDLKDFDYLTTLPKFVFGQIMTLEVDNSIKVSPMYSSSTLN